MNKITKHLFFAFIVLSLFTFISCSHDQGLIPSINDIEQDLNFTQNGDVEEDNPEWKMKTLNFIEDEYSSSIEDEYIENGDAEEDDPEFPEGY